MVHFRRGINAKNFTHLALCALMREVVVVIMCFVRFILV